MARLIARFAASLLLLCPALAFAQSNDNKALPPETAVISPGGVDMVTGVYRADGRDLAMGDAANGGITFERAMVAQAPLGQRRASHNWYIVIRYRPNSRDVDYDDTYSVESSGISRTFNKYGTAFYSAGSVTEPAKLEQISGGYRYTKADGSYIDFGAIEDGLALATSVTNPNGVKYTLTWDTDPKRVRRVSSNAGYQLILEYSGSSGLPNKVCTLNAAQTTPPSAHTCPAGVPTASYTYSGNKIASITNVAGGVSSIVYSGNTEAFYKPGLTTTPYLTNTLSTGADLITGFSDTVVKSQTYADGRSITYSYMQFEPMIADGTPGGDRGTGRGSGWTENATLTTSLSWEMRQQPMMGVETPPWYVSPSPTLITDPLGRQTTNSFGGSPYTAFLQLDARTLPNGRVETFHWQSSRMMWREWNAPSGSTDPAIRTEFAYAQGGINAFKPTTVTDPRDNDVVYTYDPTHGGVLTETQPAVGGVTPQTRNSYGQFYAWYKNSSGTLVQASTPIWRLTQTSQCRTGAPDPSGTGCALGVNDEVKTVFTYGTAGTANNLLPTSQAVTAWDATANAPVTATTIWTYDANGDKLTEDGPAPGTADTTRWRYDAMRRVIGVVSPDPDGAGSGNPHPAVRNTYDPAGRLTKVEKGTVNSQSDADWALFSASESVETTYDLLDRKLTEAKKSGGTAYALTQYSYDLYGRLECTAVRMLPATYGALPASACEQATPSTTDTDDRITRNFYDAAGQLVKVQQGVGTSVQIDYARYEYTLNGQQSAVIDANGNRAELAYDGHDRKVRWTFPSKTTVGAVDATDYERYEYDANGNRTLLRKRDEKVIVYSYDALNRVTVKDMPDTTSEDVYYAYDLRGLQLSARWGSASGDGVVNEYDGFGRKTKSTVPYRGALPGTLEYGWDISGNRTLIKHPDGALFTYEYDGLNRMVAIKEQGTTPVASISYDAQGRRVGSTRAGVTTSYGYDGVSRLASLADDLDGTASDVALSFAYNPASQIVSRARDNDAYRFTGYVNVDRSYARNGLNQYTTAGPATFCYDKNGNLTQDGASAYLYDVENRLIERRVQVSGNCEAVNYSGALLASLSYDTLGRLRKTWDGSTAIVNGANTATFWLYDGDELVLEYNSVGDTLRRYVHGPGEDDPMLWYEGSAVSAATRRSIQTDHQGSVVSIADSSGAMLAINAYDEYGIPKPGNVGRFQYTGQAWLSELGMYHYKARIYSPTLGRFMQVDPIGYDDQVNLYAYVANDPINGVDPTGMYECGNAKGDACKAAAAGVKEIRAARAFYSSRETGSNLPRNAVAAKALDRILGTLGTENDGNGLQVQVGEVPGRPDALGGYKDNVITLDTGKIRRENGLIGSTLAHEVQHKRQEKFNLGPVYTEVQPKVIGYLVDRGNGITPVPGWNAEQTIKWSLGGYCKSKYCVPMIDKAYRSEVSIPFR